MGLSNIKDAYPKFNTFFASRYASLDLELLSCLANLCKPG